MRCCPAARAVCPAAGDRGPKPTTTIVALALVVTLCAEFASLASASDATPGVVARASALFEAGQWIPAIEAYRAALRDNPKNAEAHHNLAVALGEVGRKEEARGAFEAALGVTDHPIIHNNLASLLMEMGDKEGAKTHYEAALATTPGFAQAHHNLANLRFELGDVAGAVAEYKLALEHMGDDAHSLTTTYFNFGEALVEAGRYQEAHEAYRKASRHDPSGRAGLSGMHYVGRTLCRWDRDADRTLHRLRALVRGDADANHGRSSAVVPFDALTFGFTPSELKAVSRGHSDRSVVEDGYRHSAAQVARIQASLSGRGGAAGPVRVRLGYVSSNFRDHPLMDLMRSVFGMHDRASFKLHIYATQRERRSGAAVERLRSEVEVFRNVDVGTTSNAEAAAVMNRDGVHVLVDLDAHTKLNRVAIFALRPAPFQVTYMGFAGTVGAEYLPFYIGDGVAVPPEHSAHFTERILSMPHSYYVTDYRQTYQRALLPAGPAARAAEGLPADAFVLCNFNNLLRVDRDIFAMWVAVVRAAPGSVLWLVQFPAEAEPQLRAEWRAAGLDSERLVISPKADKAVHLGRLSACDLFVDTCGRLAYNAHTTAADALWAGVPVLTMPGEKMAGRVAASILGGLGMWDLVAHSREEWIATGIALATDKARYRAVRARLGKERLRMPFFDTSRWVRNVEELYRAMLDSAMTVSSSGEARWAPKHVVVSEP